MRQGQDQMSSTVFVAGFIVLIAIFVAAAMTAFGGIQAPLNDKQDTTNDREEIAGQLADLAERCWTDADGGTASRVIDCYQVDATPDEPVRREHVADRLRDIDPGVLDMRRPIQPGTQTTVKVRYASGRINITRFQICDPSQGDTCRLAKCSCDTRCDPSAANTDQFGCVQE
jgi:hypothetical protein